MKPSRMESNIRRERANWENHIESSKPIQKFQSFLDLLIVYPNSKFKVIWDLVIIVLSIYNSITIPYEFAYALNLNEYSDIFDRVVDAMFFFDIVINFRSAYEHPKTGKLITSCKSISIRYVVYGRFPVDLVASLPLEIITLIPLDQRNLKFLGMLKMVRLLRLGRMITFLKAYQKLKFSIKFGQLVFFLLLTVHWTNWTWYLITSSSQTWFPPKDIDSQETIAFTGDSISRYLLFYYYGLVSLVGGELLPTTSSELIVATLMILSGTVLVGMVIGEFTSLFSSITN